MKKFLDEIVPFFANKRIYMSLAVILVGIAIYRVIKASFNRISNKNKGNDLISRKKKTYFRLFNNIVKYVVLLIVVVIVLKINGINVTSIIAGLGLASVIAGLALQDALKDIIMGFNIIVDGYFTVGDILKIDNIEGKVLELGLKTTKIKDIANGNIYTIANRNISSALVVSNEIYLDVPLSYELDLKTAEKVLNKIAEKIEKLENVEECKYIGLQDFKDSSITYKIKILLVKSNLKLQTRRDANGIIKQELDTNNISIPYPQLDIHTKK